MWDILKCRLCTTISDIKERISGGFVYYNVFNGMGKNPLVFA